MWALKKIYKTIITIIYMQKICKKSILNLYAITFISAVYTYTSPLTQYLVVE